MYIVNSLEYIKLVQSKPDELSSHPIALDFSVTVCGVSQGSADILSSNMAGSKGDFGDFYNMTRNSLKPGADLDGMNRVAVRSLASSVEDLHSSLGEKPKTIHLGAWLSHALTLATTESVYGPSNPYRDPKVEAAFWCVARPRAFRLSS